MPRARKPSRPLRRPRGSGSISVDADGTIRARLPSRLDPKRTAREFRPGQMAAAVAWLDGFVNPQIISAPLLVDVTLGEWAGEWWETYVEAIRPPNTARSYLYYLRQLHDLYDTPLPAVRTSALQATVGRLAAKAAPHTVEAAVGVWRRCLEAAVDDGLLTRNPARRLTLPTRAPASDRRRVTPAEVALLWPELQGHRFEAAYALALGCGLRIGAILGLRWEHVDLTGRRIWVQQQFTNGHWRELPKALNPAWQPAPAPVVAALIRHRSAQPPGCVLVMESPHVGTHRKRDKQPRPWSARSVRLDLAAIVERLGLEPMTVHAGRRGLVTAMLDGGVTLAVAAERVGHRDTRTTLLYAQASSEGRARADEVVENYLPGDDAAVEGDVRAAC